MFDPGSRIFVLTPGDNTADLYSLATGERLRRITEPLPSAAPCSTSRVIASSPRPPLTAAAERKVVAHLYAATSGKLLQKLAGHTEGLWSADFSPDGSRVVTGSEDNIARIFDIAEPAPWWRP